MNDTLFVLFGITLTPWKLVGFAGAFAFTSRWFVQVWASRKAGRPTVPLLFWYMSIVGSLLLLLYFIFGKNDAVGVFTNSFPLVLACYNLFLELTHRSKPKTPTVGGPGEVPIEDV